MAPARSTENRKPGIVNRGSLFSVHYKTCHNTPMPSKENEQSGKFLSYTFDGKELREEVKEVFHPHWARLLKPFLVLLFLWAVLGALFFFFKVSWVTGWAMLGVLAFSVFYGAIAFYVWYNTTGIITDYRVLQVRQRSLVNREVYATMWANVMSVTVSSQG